MTSRIVVVSGGASGIGRAVAIASAQRGDSVVVLDKDACGAEQAAAEALRCGAPAAFGMACDVSLESDVEKAFDQVDRRLGTPYGIFANAGIDVGGFVHELPLATWQHVLSTNLTGVFLVCKHALRRMLAAKLPGSIVCTSSPTAFVALASGGTGAYSATKGGISALVRCMAIDYARFGIRVNALVPGATESGLMWNNVPPESVASMREQLDHEIPLGRIAQPRDQAPAVLWLLSDESVYVTGSHLVCDGGVLAKASITV